MSSQLPSLSHTRLPPHPLTPHHPHSSHLHSSPHACFESCLCKSFLGVCPLNSPLSHTLDSPLTPSLLTTLTPHPSPPSLLTPSHTCFESCLCKSFLGVCPLSSPLSLTLDSPLTPSLLTISPSHPSPLISHPSSLTPHPHPSPVSEAVSVSPSWVCVPSGPPPLTLDSDSRFTLHPKTPHTSPPPLIPHPLTPLTFTCFESCLCKSFLGVCPLSSPLSLTLDSDSRFLCRCLLLACSLARDSGSSERTGEKGEGESCCSNSNSPSSYAKYSDSTGGGREGGREGRREGRREGGREGEREGGREKMREGGDGKRREKEESSTN